MSNYLFQLPLQPTILIKLWKLVTMILFVSAVLCLECSQKDYLDRFSAVGVYTEDRIWLRKHYYPKNHPIFFKIIDRF